MGEILADQRTIDIKVKFPRSEAFRNCLSSLSDNFCSVDSESVRITTFSNSDAVVFSSLVASRRACTSALKFEQSLPAGLDMDRTWWFYQGIYLM